MARQADWYFDFISPYAYLQLMRFDRLPADLEVTLRPVLFAGLLGHWEHKGPAEIPAKRVQTYRYCHWLAGRLGIPFRAPPAHPFNPLPLLRLAIALGAGRAVVEAIFRFVWGEGGAVHTEAGIGELGARLELGPEALRRRIEDPAVKQALRENTEAAVAAGVYGVPTFAVGGELFWGLDVTDMLLEHLADPGFLRDPEMQRLASLPMAAART